MRPFLDAITVVNQRSPGEQAGDQRFFVFHRRIPGGGEEVAAALSKRPLAIVGKPMPARPAMPSRSTTPGDIEASAA